MKKFKSVSLTFLICLLALFSVILFSGTTTVFATSEPVELSIQQLANEIFGDKRIKSTEYMYNLNNSPDFVYVDFDDYGYAVFLRKTSELLEYSPSGSLQYPDTAVRKYYGGPTNYFRKVAEQTFVHIGSNETLFISDTEAENYSKALLNVFSKSPVD